MITEKTTIKCEAVFSEDHTHRFLWKRVWEKSKPIATVIMLNPCESDGIITDTTTSLVINNVARLEDGFGGVAIVNLYSMLTSKLNFRWNSDEDLNHQENDSYIIKACEEASKVILAWGRAADTNKRVEERASNVIKMLMKYKEKLFVISDGGNRFGLHPLTPALRNRWILETLDSAQEKKLAQEKAKAELLAKVEAERKKANEERLEKIKANTVKMQYKPLAEIAKDKPISQGSAEPVDANDAQETIPVKPSDESTADAEPIKAETTHATETVTEA